MSKSKQSAERVWPEGHIIRQLLIHYLDVGQLSVEKAEAYVERTLGRWQSVLNQLEKQGVAVLSIPVRANCATRLEIVPGLMCDPEAEYEEEEEALDEDLVQATPQDDEEHATLVTLLNQIPGVEVEVEVEDITT